MELNINGKVVTADAPPDMPLLWVLRDTLNMTGTKFGCGIAACGACTVHVDGQPVRSCVMPVSAVAGQKITTIEALGTPDKLHALQAAWIAEQVPQCGYCQSGMLMAAAALLALSAGWSVGARPELAAQSAAADGTLDPALASAFKWRSVGPDRGGRSIAVSGVKGRPKESYFGATGGGLWKTTDGGVVWTPTFDSVHAPSIGAIAVASSNPNVVYVGSGEANIRGNVAAGNGIYKSTDAGKTWSLMGLPDSGRIGRIIIHPRDPDIVYACVPGCKLFSC